MAENKKPETGVMHHVPQVNDNTMTIRVPKPNMQVAILGIVAFITLFQTFQLIRINGATNTSIKAAPAATATSSQGTSGSNADTPQSMVGGC